MEPNWGSRQGPTVPQTAYAGGKNALGELYVPIAPAIAVFFEVRYYRFDFFLGESF
jgi:hypothetical protein